MLGKRSFSIVSMNCFMESRQAVELLDNQRVAAAGVVERFA